MAQRFKGELDPPNTKQGNEFDQKVANFHLTTLFLGGQTLFFPALLQKKIDEISRKF